MAIRFEERRTLFRWKGGGLAVGFSCMQDSLACAGAGRGDPERHR
jgi:hypothetical protein